MLRTAYIALFGIFSFTVLCPITMGAMAMNMDMGSMQMVSQVSQDQDGDTGAMPCEQCEKEEEEVIASFNSQAEVVTPVNNTVSFLAYWEYSNPLSSIHIQRPFLTNGPPIPTKTLVGTVILHT